MKASEGHGDRHLRRVISVGAAAAILLALVVASALAASTDFVPLATSPEPAGDGATSVAAADLDGDLDQDLAVANAIADNVTIHRNNGSGDFEQLVSSPEGAGDQPTSVAAADLDGDLDTDLAVANLFDDNVTILRNTGAGNFVQPASSPEVVGDAPQSVAAADLDGDGDQDLATANQSSSNVTILRNNGAGNFVQPGSSPEAAGGGASSVAAADLDGDGDQDLATANLFADNVTVLRNNGAGNFVQPGSSPEAAGDGPFAIVAAELEGDGDRDLAVANLLSDNVTVLRNTGTGNLVQPGSSPETAGDGPVAVAAADFDGDGDRDLAVANQTSSNLTVLRNNVSANFNQVGTSPEATGTSPAAVIAATLDGDADPDLAVANFSSDNVTILGNQ